MHSNTIGHHRYTRRDQRRDDFGLLHAAFELNGLTAGLLQYAAGVFDCLVWTEVETRKGHIDDHQCVVDRAAHHLGMINHLLERYRQRGAVPLYDHRQAVAD